MNAERPAGTGLRERKKQATSAALSSAALQLALERGLDQVLVEEIAARAEVSPRTFNNYFSSKEEAIVSSGHDRNDRFVAALRDRPARETLWEALDRSVPEIFPAEGELDRGWIARVNLIKSTPALAAERFTADAAAARSLAVAIAERTGMSADDDLLPRLIAGAIMSAIRVALDFWVESNTSTSLMVTVREALAGVAAGLVVPTARNEEDDSR